MQITEAQKREQEKLRLYKDFTYLVLFLGIGLFSLFCWGVIVIYEHYN